jgi:monofunctional biosynthetic peptidoglycan transglycosylase
MRIAMRWAGLALVACLVVVVALQFWYLGWIAWWKWNNPGETSFMAREEAALRQKNPKAGLRHRWVPYERISIHLKRAVITSEDARFSEHEGVDWDAIEKAYETNLKRGRPAKGGSTITQQLAKNLFLSPERSYLRKGQELVITYMIEALWDKRRILEVYLNVVEWGEGIFGAEAAARHYYGVPASQLGAEQSARLAAYLPNPKRYGRARSGPFLDKRTADIARYMPDANVP